MVDYSTTKTTKIVTWTAQVVSALIMIQTLFFKFTGAEESIYIFKTLGMEPEGRFATGIVELIASVFLLVPRTAWIGALMGIGLMSGALFFHITKLGFEIMNDGGELVYFAIATLVSCLLVVFMRRNEIVFLNKK